MGLINRSSVAWLLVAAATVTAYAGPLRGTSARSDAIGDSTRPFVLATPFYHPKNGTNATLHLTNMDDVSVSLNLRRYNAVGGLLSSTLVTVQKKATVIAFAGANSGAQMHLEVWSPSPYFTLELYFTDTASVTQRIPYAEMLKPHEKIAGAFVPLTPSRLCDTRAGTGTACSGNKLTAGELLTVTAGGVAGIPATASAVAFSAQAKAPSATGYFTFFPAGVSKPAISQVTFASGETVTTTVVVKLGTAGAFRVFNNAGSVDLLIDVAGYYT